MTRRALLALALLSLALAACGTHARPHAWIVHHQHRFATACVSNDCGPYAVSLDWAGVTIASQSGYYVFLNGTQVADISSPASQYTFTGIDCGVTSTLGVEAHDAATPTPNHSSMYSASYTTPGCGNYSLPSTVTVQAIDGGSCTSSTGPCSSNYFCSVSTEACNAGWDSPSFFPILVFNTSMPSTGDSTLINAYKNIGVNTFEGCSCSSAGLGSTTLLQQISSAGMYIIGDTNGDNASPYLYTSGLLGTANADTAVGYFWCDECEEGAGATQSRIPSATTLGETLTLSGNTNCSSGPTASLMTAVKNDYHGAHSAGDPSRFLMTNNTGQTMTGFWCGGSTVSAGYMAASDVISYDEYTITSGFNHGLGTPEHLWQQYTFLKDAQSLEATNGVSKPIWFDMEASSPMTSGQWSGVVASPAMTAAEAWNGIIAGGRGMLWFDYDFCSGAATSPAGCGYGTGTGSPLTGSSTGGTYTFAQLQTQVGETDGVIKLLAPIINSPFADSYVSSTVTGTGNSMNTMAKFESASSSDARCGNPASGCFYVFSAPAFNSTSQTATYTFKKISSCPATINSYRLLTDSTLSSPSSISVTTSGSNCQFTDTVASQSDVALYVIPNS